jgi:hypothetical protein
LRKGDAPNTWQTREMILEWYYGPQHGGGKTWSFGKYMSPNELLADKRKFMDRWPDRLYTLREGTVSLNLKSGDRFDVSGIVDWTFDGNNTSAMVWRLDPPLYSACMRPRSCATSFAGPSRSSRRQPRRPSASSTALVNSSTSTLLDGVPLACPPMRLTAVRH